MKKYDLINYFISNETFLKQVAKSIHSCSFPGPLPSLINLFFLKWLDFFLMLKLNILKESSNCETFPYDYILKYKNRTRNDLCWPVNN